MSLIPLVRTSSIAPLLAFLERGGAAFGSLRERGRAAQRDPQGLIPVAHAGCLFEEVARTAGLEDLGLQLALATDIDTFGEWGALIARSPTVGALLRTATSIHPRFNTGYRLCAGADGENAWVRLRYSRVVREGRPHVVRFSLLLWIAALRRMIGPAWRPSALLLEGVPGRDAEQLAALATDRVGFGHADSFALVFPRPLLAHAVRLPPAAAPRWTGSDPARKFAASARQTVASLLRLGALDLATTAEAAGTSARSFQRHLEQAGLTFSELVEEARLDAARALLGDPARKVIDVALALGYGDPANFTRAFRRWTGVSPQRYRRAAPAGDSRAATPAVADGPPAAAPRAGTYQIGEV